MLLTSLSIFVSHMKINMNVVRDNTSHAATQNNAICWKLMNLSYIRFPCHTFRVECIEGH